MKNKIFENLFVLEMANNHWGDVNRGKKIILEYSKLARINKIKASIKLQIRDIDTFIHNKFKSSNERYINKTLKTKLTYDEFFVLVKYIKKMGCIPMATPFDEKSVKFCSDAGLEIIKVASSDINDWILLNAIAKIKKPVILSTGGALENQIDDVITFFTHKNIPVALNHCVSKYPSEDYELELNQIDYFKNRYPGITIGLSTHEYTDWSSSMLISYAKGARLWERHIDLDLGDYDVSNYCSLPHQIAEWFKSYHKAEEMCGSNGHSRRIIDSKEEKYLISLHRGLYFNKDLKKNIIITLEELYSAVPLQIELGQLSSRDFIDSAFELTIDVKKDMPLLNSHLVGYEKKNF